MITRGYLTLLGPNIGEALMLGAVGCLIIYALSVKRLSRIYSAETLTLYMTIGAGFYLTLVSPDVEDPRP
ncbi:MAG: hypothetical protein ACR2RE_09565 [Geminicoccaceae bacterium]